MSQNISHAVMAQRAEPHDSLDFFPTPPWATRALCEWLGGKSALSQLRAWEPACGQGHMVEPLKEYFYQVTASDVHDYGYGDIYDFLLPSERTSNWIITNPPFRLGLEFVHTALDRAESVAVLVRTVFLESGERYTELFNLTPPTDVLIFSERVPMLKGRLDKTASSATSYAWFVWRGRMMGELGTALHWLPPGTRRKLERSTDYK